MPKKRLDTIMTEHPFCNLNEGIYETLCQSIIDLTLTPGESLSETALAKELSVSRSRYGMRCSAFKATVLLHRARARPFRLLQSARRIAGS